MQPLGMTLHAVKNLPETDQRETAKEEKPTLEQVFNSEEGPLLRFAYGMVNGRRDIAEELVQEAFLRLHKHWSEVELPRPWLYRCVRNLAINHLRSAKPVADLPVMSLDVYLGLEHAFPDLARVLKPTGTLIAIEALGYNPIISLYRRLTPSLRTAWETDHILTNRELRLSQKFFDGLSVHYFYLFSILAVPFRKTAIFKPLLAFLGAIDSVILKIPGVQLMAWQMIFFLTKPKPK